MKQAYQVAGAAQAKADDIGQPMNVAIVDAGNNLLAFGRMDGAWLGSIQIAMDKAFTARAFDMPTQELEPMAQPGQPLFGINSTNGGRVVIFRGGIPLEANGEIVGAIGVSGGTPAQDQQCAKAGAGATGE
jgi:uncharacterized protein GlcG (DUF336 family)